MRINTGDEPPALLHSRRCKSFFNSSFIVFEKGSFVLYLNNIHLQRCCSFPWIRSSSSLLQMIRHLLTVRYCFLLYQTNDDMIDDTPFEFFKQTLLSEISREILRSNMRILKRMMRSRKISHTFVFCVRIFDFFVSSIYAVVYGK
jgi:hypothetical protein